jgi:hypothetical protein
VSDQRKKLRSAFIALFLLAQIFVPLCGLYASHLFGRPVRFSWHMFSRIEGDRAADGIDEGHRIGEAGR